MSENTVVAALDQGTSSTRVILFDIHGKIAFVHQVEVSQHTPAPGWVQEDPDEIFATAETCMCAAAAFAAEKKLKIAALGVTNQRETTIAWDKKTGKPLHEAIVWLDTRTKDIVTRTKERMDGKAEELIRGKTGLPLATYFSACKIRWLLDNSPEVQQAVREDRCAFGTVDSWLLWRLTAGKVHVTDVTNASRTMLMDLATQQWDEELCKFFDVPRVSLPEIRSCSEVYGNVSVCKGTCFEGVPICGCLGDQQAALVGQLCLEPGRAKCTYGTGCFMLRNVGLRPVSSAHGLVSTVAYKLGPNARVHFALEGSVAVAGVAVQWLRDNLGIISRSAEIDELAGSVDDTGGVYFVPAFSGLFAPRWRSDARGCIVGMTQFTTKAHIARATLEATCFQALELLLAMDKDASDDSTGKLAELRVDGGMTVNNLMMQLQADYLGLPVIRPAMRETTAFGAALAAGFAQGVWHRSNDGTTVDGITPDDTTFKPVISEEERKKRLARWQMAVERSLNWV